MEKCKILNEKVMESMKSVLPIVLIVLLLSFSVSPIQNGMMMSFLLGAAFLILGCSLFTLGADIAMTPIGEMIGSSLTKSKRIVWIVVISFVLGVIITISEPDLTVLASQIPTIPDAKLILAVAVGVGIFLSLSLLRIFLGVSLKVILAISYGILFLLSIFVSNEFLGVAFDSGGVTTGPMTVPFIMALGIGVSRIRSDEHGNDDSFGLVAMSSIGPILAVLLMGMQHKTNQTTASAILVQNPQDTNKLFQIFIHAFPSYMKDVAIALCPILIFFLILYFTKLHLKKQQIIRLMAGMIYTYFGLVLFLTGVNVGFLPVGYYLGQILAKLSYSWILIPIGMVIGYFIVAAEPAVHVLTKQVNEITSGAVSEKTLLKSLAISMAISLGLSMIRVLLGISVMWFLIPGYLIALIIMFAVPDIFTAIAFDSGGVVSGPMTATFILPLVIGACQSKGGNVAIDAFGVIAMVAMTPLITIQVMGYITKRKACYIREQTSINLKAMDQEDIIEL